MKTKQNRNAICKSLKFKVELNGSLEDGLINPFFLSSSSSSFLNLLYVVGPYPHIMHQYVVQVFSYRCVICDIIVQCQCPLI